MMMCAACVGVCEDGDYVISRKVFDHVTELCGFLIQGLNPLHCCIPGFVARLLISLTLNQLGLQRSNGALVNLDFRGTTDVIGICNLQLCLGICKVPYRFHMTRIESLQFFRQ